MSLPKIAASDEGEVAERWGVKLGVVATSAGEAAP